jgi:DNA-binding CsgD family transcriptional regulator/predicted negative regulator of RcsB-dependent stress response
VDKHNFIKKVATFMTASFNESVICPVLIGRTAELAAFHLLIDQTKSGKRQVSLLSGEAGVGKSRLVAEVKTHAKREGFFLLQGNCFQADRAFPYAPFLDLLRSYFSGLSPLTKHHNLTLLAQELAQVLPDVIPLIPEHPPLIVTSPLDPQQEQRRLFALLLNFFTELATYQPLLCLLEDLHWSDEASLELLLYLARSSTRLPILFVLTYRSDEESAELRHCLAEFDRERLAQDLSLQRLDRAGVDAMLQAIFAMHHAVHTGLLDSLYQLTEGNPFFIEEYLKSLIATGEITDKEGVWERTLLFGTHTHFPFIPRSVHDTVYQRTKQLSVPARQVLTLAAVSGRRFDLTIVQQIMHIGELDLFAWMKELVAAQLVMEEAADQFVFRHALTRQAVYSELLTGERRTLHRTIAETIEKRVFPSSILDAQLIDLAYHFYAGEVWSKAVEYGQRAGERTLNLYAPRAAVEHFTQALDAASQMKMKPVATIYQLRGQAYELLGEFEQARRDYAQALRIAQETQDRLLEWQCLLALGFLWAGHDYTQAGSWFSDALTLASTLADPVLQARSLNRLGNWLLNTGQPEEGLQAHREALDLFETMKDTQGMAETLDLLGQAHGLHNDLITSVSEFGQAIDLFRSLNDMQSLVSSLTSRAVYAGPNLAETTLSALLTRDECLRDTTEALRLAHRIDSPSGQAYAELVSGMMLTSFGEFGAALSHAQEALRLATEIEHQQWMAGAFFVIGRLSVFLLDAPSAIKTLEAGLALASQVGSAWWTGNITAYLTLAYLLRNEPSRAEALLETSLPSTQRPRTSPERRLFWVRGELALAQGHPDIALDIADTLLITAPGADSTKQPIPWLLKLKGEALVALGRTEEAIRALSEAAHGALQRQEQVLLWHIHRAAGYAHQRLKQEDLAQHNFSSARQGIASLASTIVDVSLHDQFLQAALATLPREKSIAAKRAAKQAFSGLTERELEVVALIAQGKSNREIAETLVVAKITIETHINNILHKLGFTSRTQIVLWAVERGMVKY